MLFLVLALKYSFDMCLLNNFSYNIYNQIFKSHIFHTEDLFICAVVHTEKWRLFLLAGHVLECWRCDGILFRVAQESQPCQLWKTNLQIWEGLKLPPPQWVQTCSSCFCLDTDCIYIVWQLLFVRDVLQIGMKNNDKTQTNVINHSYKFFVCVHACDPKHFIQMERQHQN